MAELIKDLLRKNNLTVQEQWDSMTPDERALPSTEVPMTPDSAPWYVVDKAEKKANEAIGFRGHDFEELSEDDRKRWNDMRRDEIWKAVNEYNSSPVGDGFSEDTVHMIRTMLHMIELAGVHLHRIDWLLAGDDGEDAFAKRTMEDVERLRASWKNDKPGKEGSR